MPATEARNPRLRSGKITPSTVAKSLRLKVFLTGRVAAEANGRVLDEARFPGRQGRLLFAYLVVARSRPVPRDELAEAIWGESPPATWEKALTVIASKLRGLVAEDGITLTNAFGCYRLDLPEGTWVDVFAAASGAQDAEEALAAGELDQARAAAESAESLARPLFLPGEDGAWVEQERRDLADIRERALSVLADACLRSGAAREAAKWAEELIALSPFREAGYRRLMEAHVVAGNRAEALRVYEQCRQLLAEELGAYPSPETDSIYRALLEAPQTSVRTTPVAEPTVEPGKSELSRAQTEALPLRAEQVVERRSRKRRAVLLSALVGVIATAVVVPLVVFGQGEAEAARPSRRPATRWPWSTRARVALSRPPPSAQRPRPSRPAKVRIGSPTPTATRCRGSTLERTPSSTRFQLATARAGLRPAPARSGWSTASTPRSRGSTRARTRSSRRSPSGAGRAGSSTRPARSGSRTRATERSRGSTPRAARRPPLQVAATELAFGAGTLWASQRAAGQVVRIDPTTGKQVFAPIHVGNGPTGIAFGHGAAWVANSLDGTVSRIDPETNSVTATVPTGNGPDAVAVDPRGIWVSNQFDGNVVRIDPGRNQVAQRVSVGSRVSGLAMSGDAVLVAVPHSGAGHRGGTLVLRTNGPRKKGTPTPSTRSTTRFRGTRTFCHSCG